MPDPAPHPERTPTLSVRSLSRSFGSRAALRDVSFELWSGELVAVIGPNGAGKTTLLSILAGVLSASDGRIIVAAKRSLGWVPQQPAIYAKLSVLENLRLFARLEGVADPDAAVRRMLREADLDDRAGDEVGQLSGGNQQRVNIAIGLLPAPQVLLLDEPSSSLDPRQRQRLWEFIGSLRRQGTTVMFSTHNVFEAERYADRVLVLVDGELLFTGTAGELEQTVGGESTSESAGPGDFETAFVNFLHVHGH
jgi:ABC-2 type transport system ATP-binding protein